MDVDTQRTQTWKSRPRSAFNRMTDAEHADHMKNGICFNCHKKGHISRECPERRGPKAAVRSMETVIAPTNDKQDAQEALIASLMDKIAAMEKAAAERKDFH